ncbi:exo-alpha-sialidase [Chitinophaga horti]|uniref:Exo-alpha-sialidase n=1 Tax=Chitinophaga horti TaxID=2920382 RepID=A0ABY6J819_9BACT|nr:sialidase family protein [Chitinophaga horti]UYQ95835.1 exo-alpha-sialidase [Chitinophaga horti]
MKKLLLLLLVIPLAGFGQTSWKQLSAGMLFDKVPFAQCHASTIVEYRPGLLMAAWFAGSHEGNKDVKIWLSTSAKGKWSAPKVVAADSTYPCWNPVLFKDQSNLLHLYYKVGPNPMGWWGMEITSADNGKSWSAPKRFADGLLGPIKNKPVQLANGVILSPTSKETSQAWRAYIERSTDGGNSWTSIPVDTAGKYDIIQPSILQYADGRLQLLCRSKQGKVMQSWSNDAGLTWSAVTPTSLLNPNSGTDAVTLKNGWQLIVYNPDIPGKEWSEGRTKLRVAVSQNGNEWQDVAVLENQSKGEFSYPAVIQTKDGKVHITYTYDRKNIRYVVLKAR